LATLRIFELTSGNLKTCESTERPEEFTNKNRNL